MDRGHRPRIAVGWRVGCVTAVGTFVLLAAAHAQETPAASPGGQAPVHATPVPSATPWVQASPPPGLATPPVPEHTPPPKPLKPAKLPNPAKQSPKPLPPPVSPVPPSASPSSENTMRAMMRRRAEEEHSQPVAEGEPPNKPYVRDPAALEQLPPEERAAYQRNLPLWKQLPTDERQEIRRQANERARQETEKAYAESGLNLDHDQREVFNLRYHQERRRLERELQEKIDAERTRRLGEITARLKQEFAGRNLPPGPPAPAPTFAATPAPRPAGATPSVSNADTLLEPGTGLKR